MWFFQDILHSTKPTHFSQIYYFFIIGQMCFSAGWNCFASRICPAGRSAENPDIDHEEEWWQNTPLSESNTNTERLWFNSVDRDTIFWTGIQLLDGQQEVNNNRTPVLPQTTVLSQHHQTFFTRYAAISFLKADKTYVYVFGMLQGFLENLLQNGNLFCSATASRTRQKPHWVSPSFGSIILVAS